MTTINPPAGIARVSELMQAISPLPCLEILMTIGTGEACVCHLEAALGYRQAYISQHLMALREAGLLSTRRDGKYVFYHLEKPEIMEMVELAVRLAGLDMSVVADRINLSKSSCECPTCTTQVVAREAA